MPEVRDLMLPRLFRENVRYRPSRAHDRSVTQNGSVSGIVMDKTLRGRNPTRIASVFPQEESPLRLHRNYASNAIGLLIVAGLMVGCAATPAATSAPASAPVVAATTAAPTLAPAPTPTPTRTATPATAGFFRFPCGTVTAYAAPTATAAGSVSLGTSTFALARASGPANNAELPVGRSLCVNGDQDATAMFTQFSVSPMGPGICSVVAAYTPASATAPATIDFSTPKPPVRIPVASGVTFAPTQVTGDQCFRVTPDAQGTAQITEYIGPRR